MTNTIQMTKAQREAAEREQLKSSFSEVSSDELYKNATMQVPFEQVAAMFNNTQELARINVLQYYIAKDKELMTVSEFCTLRDLELSKGIKINLTKALRAIVTSQCSTVPHIMKITNAGLFPKLLILREAGKVMDMPTLAGKITATEEEREQMNAVRLELEHKINKPEQDKEGE